MGARVPRMNQRSRGSEELVSCLVNGLGHLRNLEQSGLIRGPTAHRSFL